MTDISQLKRKRTTKRNIVTKSTLVEVDKLLRGVENLDIDERIIELSTRFDFLSSSVDAVKKWDDEIANLVDNDDHAEKE